MAKEDPVSLDLMEAYMGHLDLSYYPFGTETYGISEQHFEGTMIPFNKENVGSDVFKELWRKDGEHDLVFGTDGSGKTTLCNRIVYACQHREDERNVLPIVFDIVRDDDLKGLDAENFEQVAESLYNKRLEQAIQKAPFQVDGKEETFLLVDGFKGHGRDTNISPDLFGVVANLTQLGSKVKLKAFLPYQWKGWVNFVLPHGMEFSEHEIHWTKQGIKRLIYERLGDSSEGDFDSLAELAEPSVELDVESEIADFLASPKIRALNPRLAITLVDQVFQCHLVKDGPQGLFNRRDFDFAKAWLADQRDPLMMIARGMAKVVGKKTSW